MAYEVSYWKMQGKYDYELKRCRIARKEDIETHRLIESRPAETDIILLDRSDRQSPIAHTLWQTSNYVDLNDRLDSPSDKLRELAKDADKDGY